MTNGLALVLAADEGFARATAVALHSTLAHLSPSTQPQIYVLDNGLSEDSRNRLRRVTDSVSRHQIEWLGVPAGRLETRESGSYLTPTTYARLLIPELLPQNIQRAVYMDGDVLVRSDVSALFRIGLHGASFGAVRDFVSPEDVDPTSSAFEPVESRPIFNAGVLVIDVARWRAERFADQALAYARSAEQPLPHADQDAMNAVATKDDWCELDYRWNFQVTLMYRPELSGDTLGVWLRESHAETYRDAAIVHFAAAPKPWDPWSFGTSLGKTEWARALLRSGWYSRAEALKWLAPWMAKRVVDAGRRATAPSS